MISSNEKDRILVGRSLAEGGVPCDANSPLPVGPKGMLSGGHVRKVPISNIKHVPI